MDGLTIEKPLIFNLMNKSKLSRAQIVKAFRLNSIWKSLLKHLQRI